MKNLIHFSRNSSTDQIWDLIEVPKNKKVFINFGSRSVAAVEAANRNYDLMFNHPNCIENASNKKLFEKRLRTFINNSLLDFNPEVDNSVLNKIPTIIFEDFITPSGNVVWSNIFTVIKQFPVLVKPVKGKGGEGILKFDTKEELTAWRAEVGTEALKGYLLQEYEQPNLSKNYEFRVSVMVPLVGTPTKYSEENNNSLGVISIRRKFLTKKGIEEGKFTRNLEEGLSFFRTIPLTPDDTEYVVGKQTLSLEMLALVAVNAVSLCELEFGAVDILYNSETGRFSVLEVNTAPSLGDDGSAVAQEFVAAFNQTIKILL